MGEYIRLDEAGHYKLGTCESLYYARFEDLRGWIRDGRAARSSGNLPPAEYAGGAFRFRFPFPDEDGDEAERIAAYGREYDRGLVVPVPAGFDWSDQHMDLTRWVGIGPAGAWAPGAAVSPWDHVGLNVFLPCPWGADAGKLNCSPIPERSVVKLCQQRPIDGQLWAVVGCPFCGVLWRLDSAAAAAWVAFLRAGHPEFAELARRIEAGYEPGAGLLGV